MLKTISLALIVAAAAPLCANSLFEGKKAEKAGKDWFKTLPDWVNNLGADGRHPRSWFTGADGKPHRYRIESADARGLKTRELLDTGKRDEKDEPVRVPAEEVVSFEWKQWESRYLATTYPVETNEDDRDVAAFAAWLYCEREADLIANRVLTVLYLRNEDLREPVCEFIREAEGLKKATPLATFEMWDVDFKVFRTILIPAEKAESYRDDREKAAKDRLVELRSEFEDAVKRTLTLEQLEYELKRWPKDFADTKAATEFAAMHKKALDGVTAARKQVEVHVDAADRSKPDGWKLVAETYEKALALDTRSPKLLSQVANAWLEYGRPEFSAKENKWICTHEAGIRSARDRYLQWLEREAANVDVMEALVKCHDILGDTTAADRLRASIKNLK
jgi:hypothetical protein